MPSTDTLISKSSREYHPWINVDTPIIMQPKIILGSFPIWSLTKHEFDINDQSHFVSSRIKKTGEFPFFYGSTVNRFWSWYKTYLDRDIELLNKDSILSSLKANQIGITDAILSCTRKEKSALDKDLSKRLYNHRFFTYPQPGEVKKILCTSKGVMNEMLLHNDFFQQHRQLQLDAAAAYQFQDQFVKNIMGDPQLITKPIFTQIAVENGGIIQCLALPSPGSPYRRLIDFGLDKVEAHKYLDNYLKNAFGWLQT
ncbi:hypothetical protein JN11_00839 [Mucilaginibacter frigoritolerans]|uniref:Uncharacterized protein n=1 Tax=Mucilaginibacter frigoritolerans TaxID=652788 RepID=A0A562UDQ9_9SPHI|nr:hypothetical protein [Mucilaginibacter frigoritolerans]TWJ03301.1 hypothetical protein JN11_00839 [Mucilaginibacter frigoritolerans]